MKHIGNNGKIDDIASAIYESMREGIIVARPVTGRKVTYSLYMEDNAGYMLLQEKDLQLFKEGSNPFWSDISVSTDIEDYLTYPDIRKKLDTFMLEATEAGMLVGLRANMQSRSFDLYIKDYYR